MILIIPLYVIFGLDSMTIGVEVENIQQDKLICPICIEPMKTSQRVIRLQCDGKHRFHKDCADSWFLNHNTCPTCRAVVPYKVPFNLARLRSLLSKHPRTLNIAFIMSAYMIIALIVAILTNHSP